MTFEIRRLHCIFCGANLHGHVYSEKENYYYSCLEKAGIIARINYFPELFPANIFEVAAKLRIQPEEVAASVRRFIFHKAMEWNKQHKNAIISEDEINNTLANPILPTTEEQEQDFLIYLSVLLRYKGNYLSATPENVTRIFLAQHYCGFAHLMGLCSMTEYLAKKGLINCSLLAWKKQPLNSLTLTIQGWKSVESAQKYNFFAKNAFMAMKYGDSESERELKQKFFAGIQQAIAKTGFSIHRVDDKMRSGLIDSLMISDIEHSRFVVTDLSDNNYGAYWEAGYAEGKGIPVIYICKNADQKPHFDVNHRNTIFFDTENELHEKLIQFIRDNMPEAY